MRNAEEKRALFVIITDYPGGAERVVSTLASRLASQPGWRVEIKIVCSQLANSFTSKSVASRVHVSYGVSENWYISFILFPFRILFRRFDLVFCTHIYVNAAVSAMRRVGAVRINRLVLRESMSLFDRFTGFKAPLFRFLYRRYGTEDLLIAQTGYMAEHVKPWLPKASERRLRALPNPIDVAAVRTAAAEPLDGELARALVGSCNIVFCGRFTAFKRPELALEVFRLVRERCPQARLVFVGGGPLEAEVRERAALFGLSDCVLFLGQRPNPYPIMAACEYGLLTSANEGFPNVVLEMMACGIRKIVLTPCAGDLDSLSGVAVSRTHQAEELADTLLQAIESREDCSLTYQAVAFGRSADSYLARVLGTQGSYDDEDGMGAR